MTPASAPPDFASLDAPGFQSLAKARLFTDPPDRGLAVAAPIRPSDFDLNPQFDTEPERPLRAAAVLVPIIARPSLTVLLTQRTPHLAAHAGQIAFPGGKVEASDAGPLAAALREAHEEIGLDPALVAPLGFLEPYRTVTGFLVYPAVALVRADCALTPDPQEVADVFEVPLPFLMNPANHRIDSRTFAGQARHYYAMPYEQRYIWGATAGIIRTLARRLNGA